MRISKIKIFQGFTLIEVLIALLIMAIIAVIGMTGLQAVVLTDSRQEVVNKDLGQLQFAYLIIQRDLLQATNRPIRDTEDALRPGFLGANRAGQNLHFDLSTPAELMLEFTRTGISNPQNLEGRTSLQRITYLYDGNQVMRLVYPMLDRVSKTPFFEQILLNNITDLQLFYFDRYGQRFNQWVMQVAETPEWLQTWQQMAVMPTAMEWRFTHPRYGNIVWFFELTGTNYEEIR